MSDIELKLAGIEPGVRRTAEGVFALVDVVIICTSVIPDRHLVMLSADRALATACGIVREETGVGRWSDVCRVDRQLAALTTSGAAI